MSKEVCRQSWGTLNLWSSGTFFWTIHLPILSWTTIRISNKGGEVWCIFCLHPRSTCRSCIDCQRKKLIKLTKNLSYFHCVTGYPPDILHNIFEGIVPLELGLCFSVFISKKYFTFSELNSAISQFPYKWADMTNCPQPVPATFSSRKRIGGHAHENWALIRLLPFIIGHRIPLYDPAWLLLMSLKDIIELVVFSSP